MFKFLWKLYILAIDVRFIIINNNKNNKMWINNQH